MKLGRLSTLGLLVLLAGACTEFPSIPDTGCGNGVIEPETEDCDTFDPPGSICRPKGSDNECHVDCSLDDDGLQRKCPSGWGCDAESVCRAPSGQFSESSLASDVGAWTLDAGDFDGDGRQDVMSSEPLDATGATRLRFNYFDAQGALSETRLFPKTLLSPTINQISQGDARSDIAFTTGALGVMYGRRDRNWVPEVFSSYRRPNASVRSVGVYERSVQWSPAFTTFITAGAESGFYLGNPDTGMLENRLAVPGTIDRLAGDLVSGNVFEDSKHSPCLEPVFAMRGATHFSIVDVCDTDESGSVIWRASFRLTEIALEPRAAIDVAPQVLDMNGDGHLDVLLGAAGRPYVALGDGTALSVATPYVDHEGDPAFPPGTPLAAADLTGDGVLDFVYPDRLLVSQLAYVGATPVYQNIGNRLTTPWTVAKIADFNGNGKLDVVAASSGSLNLDFFNGTGTHNFSASTVSTSAPVQLMSAGDFDGDLITDLALFEVPLPGQSVSKMKVAFGNAFAPLGTPLPVGQIGHAEALSSYQDGGRDNLTVCSSEPVDGVKNGALTLLSAGPDRVPFAPLTLTEFSLTGSVQDAGSFAVVSGHFLNRGQTDLLALAFFRDDQRVPPAINVWWVPAITLPGSSSSRLPGALDRRLEPVSLSADGETFTADVAATSADLDHDARDEAIFAMPADGGSRCGLLLIGADSAGSLGSAAQEPVIVDEPCPDPQLMAVTLDGHDPRFPDLALLTGKKDAVNRHLYVLLNDGSGHFSGQNLVLVSEFGDSPQAFTALDHGAGGLAYLTKDALHLIAVPDARNVVTPRLLPDDLVVSDGTGIVAADVNGDHLVDLIFSESGRLRVLKAGMKLR